MKCINKQQRYLNGEKMLMLKIPITNTNGKSTKDLIKTLSDNNLNLQHNCYIDLRSITRCCRYWNPNTPAILSIFAGRIVDTGIDPLPIMREAVKIAKVKPKSEILWASTRELFNIFQAEESKLPNNNVPHDILNKFNILGKDLTQLSLETVKTFYNDAKSAGFKI